ncbi:MAG TPA: hypothetical protein VFQ42_03990 [Mycobacterium sp.]|nr:hypothetical protein [Mycobacterium sp.]
MPGLAPQTAAWGRNWPRQAIGPSRGASLLGVPILVQQFGGDLRLAVQIAWGANLMADQSTWTWTDVTPDVQYQQKIVIKLGRADESSTPQPATCQFTVNNRAGSYSKGPQGPNWPFVRKGTPIRVVIIYQGITDTRFQGNVVSWTPEWDTTGNYAVVHIEADGSKRRLNQGTEVLASTLTRAVPKLANLVAYWPCEDGASAGSFASAMPGGGAPLQVSGATPQLASYSGFAGSLPIPTFTTDTWSAPIPSYADSGSGQVRFLISVPSATVPPDQAVIFAASTAGSIASIQLRYLFGGGLRLLGYDIANNQLFDSGSMGFSLAGNAMQCSVQWVNSGGNVTFTVSQLNAQVGANAGYVTVPVTGQSLNGIMNISFSPNGNMTGTSLGQIYIQNQSDDIFALNQQIVAFASETASARLSRLCSEQGENLQLFGNSSQTMGPQLPDSFINLIEAAATVDQGYLADGLGPGLLYFARGPELECLPVAMPLAANLGHVEQPVTPIDDDQNIVNSYTASRASGSTVTYTDTTGPLSPANIGTYPSSNTVNCYLDTQLLDFASWRVHLGNLDDYRYPTLHIALHHHPELLRYWKSAQHMLANRIDVTNLQAVRKQQAPQAVSLIAQGWTETIDQFTWSVAMNCTSYLPYRIITLAQDTGDTGEFLCHLDTDGSTTAGDTPAGSITMTVATTSGPIWTTASDDFPFDVSANGWQLTVTGITGSSSPQTFTLAAATTADIPANSPVSIWHPTYLDL